MSRRGRKPTEGAFRRVGSEGQGCSGLLSPSVAVPSVPLRRAPSLPGPRCCCAAGAQPSSAGSHIAASEPAPSGPQSAPQANLPQSLVAKMFGMVPGCTCSGARSCSPESLPLALTPTGLDTWTLQPDVAQDVGAERGSPGARRRGRFHCALTETLQTHNSREKSAVVSPSTDSEHWGRRSAGCRSPTSGHPTASLQMPLCGLNLTVIPFPWFKGNLACPLLSSFRG